MGFAEVFNSLIPDIQVYLLVELANRQADMVSKLNVLLLLLRRFPKNIESFGVGFTFFLIILLLFFALLAGIIA